MRYEIKTIVEDFYRFIKNPKELFTESISNAQKWKIVFSILLVGFALVFISSAIISFIELNIFELDSNPIESIFDNKGVIQILLLASLFIPFIEELIFRFPLKYERNLLFHFADYLTKNKALPFWNKNFKFFFYLSAVLFGLMHLTNYSNTNTLFYVLAPLIILPQFIGGISLGYIRLRLGFFWGVLQHGLYNFILFIIPLAFFNVTTIVDIDNKDYTLNIEKLEFGLDKPSDFKRHQSELIIDSIIATNYRVKFLVENLNSKDSILLKNSKRINFRFVNKSNLNNLDSIVLTALKNGLKPEK